jgi:hypothetical protein
MGQGQVRGSHLPCPVVCTDPPGPPYRLATLTGSSIISVTGVLGVVPLSTSGGTWDTMNSPDLRRTLRTILRVLEGSCPQPVQV